jgi:hypothetical protein
VKEKVSCHGLSQLTDFAPLAPALARFGRVGCEATNQKVGSSNPPGRTMFLPMSRAAHQSLTDIFKVDARLP